MTVIVLGIIVDVFSIQGESDFITWLDIKTPLWKRHSINLQKISPGEYQIYKKKQKQKLPLSYIIGKSHIHGYFLS